MAQKMSQAAHPSFALAYAAYANACAMFYCNYSRDRVWVERAREASGKAVALRWDLPEVQVSQDWVLYAAELHDATARAHITYSAAPCSLRDATRKF